MCSTTNINTNNNPGLTHKWTRLVLFHAVEHSVPVLLWGEPIDLYLDVGFALASQPPKEVKVRVWNMANPEDAHAEPTDEVLTVKTVFSPLSSSREGLASFKSKNPFEEQNETIQKSSQADNNDVQTYTHNVTYRNTRGEVPTGFSSSRTTSSSKLDRDPSRPVLCRPVTDRPMKLPDISQCPDHVTFSPAIEDDEEMHMEIQFTVLQRDGGESSAKEDITKHIAGYTLAVTQRIRTIGDTFQAGPEHDGIDAFCPFGPVLISAEQLPRPEDLSVKLVINGVETSLPVQGATHRDVRRSMRHSAEICDKKGIPRGGAYSMIGIPAGLVRGREPTVRIRKGDQVVFKASHGIGHLMNSIYQVRVPHRVRAAPATA